MSARGDKLRQARCLSYFAVLGRNGLFGLTVGGCGPSQRQEFMASGDVASVLRKQRGMNAGPQPPFCSVPDRCPWLDATQVTMGRSSYLH